tara:strand:- start:176 stop:529 length:354 start_codon:yes stop_codon:yes gene_type:complete
MDRRRFTGKEDVALKQIVNERGTRRISWSDVVTKLHELGYEKRTAKSVRNRHLRQKKVDASMFYLPGRNRCRKCGRSQRGHVCLIEEAEESPLPPGEPPANPEAGEEEGEEEQESSS